jgi:hypothetical protein
VWGGVCVFGGFIVKEVVTYCDSMTDVIRRFVPRSDLHLLGHFRLGRSEPFLHDSVQGVFHDLTAYIFRLDTSIDMSEEGVGNDIYRHCIP